jgi:hypothetical protein
MFGGSWGAFGTAGCHFFNSDHELYRAIRAIAAVRREQPALRYGRQYFREISGNGTDFGHPLDGRCTLAWSRILDTEELLVAMNLTAEPRSDCVTVDRKLSARGQTMRDLLEPARRVTVEETPNGRAFVRLTLPPHGFAIMKCG